MRNSLVFLAAATAPLASAFPQAMKNSFVKRREPTFQSGRSNTGVVKATTFDAKDQYVDITPGSGHEFQAPGSTDLRGECPGLNAASNHAFLPRNGIASITQTVDGLGSAYGMGPDLAAFLAVVAIALSGDYLSMTWSIGGAYPSGIPGLGTPQGILGTHNKYEGDASPGRGDAYLNGGNQVLRMESFDNLYNMAEEYTLDILAAHNDYVYSYSVENNPYYFSAPFSGLVTPAAHEFIINFMSNHSAENPSGWLDRNMLKTFFAISGPDDNHVYSAGMERIPDNWYRRPSTLPYTIPGNLADTGIAAVMYPGMVGVGGNTGTTNSYTGVDLGNLTGGAYNAETLFQGNNFGCFAIQAFMAGLPDQLIGAAAPVISAIQNMVSQNLNPTLSELGCPEMPNYNPDVFAAYPGYSYNPQNVQSS